MHGSDPYPSKEHEERYLLSILNGIRDGFQCSMDRYSFAVHPTLSRILFVI